MNASLLRIALLLSLAVNLGVLGAVSWRLLEPSGRPPDAEVAVPGLPAHLGLDASQLERWRAAERAFLAKLAEGGNAIAGHRERMIREIFSDSPDATRIEAERASIAGLQEAQQRLVIEQLLAERAVLDPAQRARLAEVLLEQPVGSSVFERLHRE